MEDVINDHMVQFGDLVLDRFQSLDEAETLECAKVIASILESDLPEDHVKVLVDYLKSILEVVYANKYEQNRIN